MKKKISPDTLMPLETYAKQRPAFREQVIAHKKNRALHLGDHITLLFEDELTIRYQVQEMLRVERIFEEEGILDELQAYNPLIPDGSNWKSTMMIEYPDEQQRRTELAQLIGVEDRVWVQVSGYEQVFAIADEDLERENADKTSSVHFLRFELTSAMKIALLAGACLSAGVDHSHYHFSCAEVSDPLRSALMADLSH
jgi:hypothetical protein